MFSGVALYRRWKTAGGGKKRKERKKESIARFEREGRMVVDRRRVYETVFRVRVTGDFEFFRPIGYIYICISTFTSKFVWTSWGGNFGKSLEVNFSPWNANWIVTFSNWLFPRPIWFFFFLANFDHFKNIFFFFFPWSLTELSRIDRKGDVIMIGKTRREDFSSSSDLLFIRVLIIRGRRGKEPRLFHFY